MSEHQIKIGIDSDEVDREKIRNIIEIELEEDEIQHPKRKLSGVEQETIPILFSLIFNNEETLVAIIQLLRDRLEAEIKMVLNDGSVIQVPIELDIDIQVDISEINLIKLVHEYTGNE